MAEEQECSHSCGSCGVEGCGERTAPSKYTTNAASNVKHVIGVVSGKGGVGKSLVTSLLASELRKKGFNVGILDADVTGPSIPKTFGVTDKLHADETGIYPALTDSGIKVMSVNLMLPKGDMPVAWRGPVVSGIINAGDCHAGIFVLGIRGNRMGERTVSVGRYCYFPRFGKCVE